MADNFENVCVEAVYKRGILAAENQAACAFRIPSIDVRLTERALRTFQPVRLRPEDFKPGEPYHVIGMVNGEITTVDADCAREPGTSQNILWAAVAERHRGTGHIGIGLLHGYGLKSGAVATSISHDSHNIIVAGTCAEDCSAAANQAADLNGGIVVWSHGKPAAEVPLPIAGIMSDRPLETVNSEPEAAKKAAYALGVNPKIDPFMTLSFMAFPVIPTLRLTTQGIFDVTKQRYL